MATKKLNTRIQNKIDSEANWNRNPDFVPLKGEMIIYSKDANNPKPRVKFGDGVTPLRNLKFAGGSGAQLTPIKKPTVSGSLTYNKNSQSPTWLNYDPSKMTMTGTTSATNAGTYTTTFTPLTGYCWEEDESTSVISVTWTINKAPANLRVNTSYIAIDTTFTSKKFTYSSNSDASISCSTSLYQSNGDDVPSTAVYFEFNINTSTSEIEMSLAFGSEYLDFVSYGTLRVQQLATTNYLSASVEIPIQAISGLDGYTWTQIAQFVGDSDAGNLGAIGDTKTITLTPNQRIRLPEGQETVKVYLANAFEESEGGDGTGPANGYLFAGFKDNEGRDIAITPDPLIMEKQWMPGNLGLIFKTSNDNDIDGFEHADPRDMWKLALDAAGTHDLKYYCTNIPDAVHNKIIVECHEDPATAEGGNCMISTPDGTLLCKITSFGTTFSGEAYFADITLTETQYIDKRLFNFLRECLIRCNTANIDENEIGWLKWNDLLLSTSRIFSGPVDTPVLIGGHSYSGGITNNLYVSVSGTGDYTTEQYAYVYDDVSLDYFYDGREWRDTLGTQKYLKFKTPTSTANPVEVLPLFFILENTKRISPRPLNYWQVHGSGVYNVDAERYINFSSSIQTNSTDYFGNTSRPCYTFYGTFDFPDANKTYIELSISEGTGEITGTRAGGYSDHICRWEDGTFNCTVDEAYRNMIVSSWGDNNALTANEFNTLMEMLFNHYDISGSWIWESTNGDDIIGAIENSGLSGIYDVNFRAGNIISNDNLPQQQYGLSFQQNNTYLKYEGPNPIAVVSSTFHPEYAAMHFGDVPQSLPLDVINFIKANARYMSVGFAGSLVRPRSDDAGIYNRWMAQHLRQAVVGGITDEYIPKDDRNSLYAALPQDLKDVLSIIYDYDPAGADYVVEDKLTLPYINEITDSYSGSRLIISDRLRRDIWKEGILIRYFESGNPIKKYDVWNKDHVCYQHSASIGEDAPGEAQYSMIKDENTSAQYYEDHLQFDGNTNVQHAGLAPLFLLGRACMADSKGKQLRVYDMNGTTVETIAIYPTTTWRNYINSFQNHNYNDILHFVDDGDKVRYTNGDVICTGDHEQGPLVPVHPDELIGTYCYICGSSSTDYRRFTVDGVGYYISAGEQTIEYSNIYHSDELIVGDNEIILTRDGRSYVRSDGTVLTRYTTIEDGDAFVLQEAKIKVILSGGGDTREYLVPNINITWNTLAHDTYLSTAFYIQNNDNVGYKLGANSYNTIHESGYVDGSPVRKQDMIKTDTIYIAYQ